MARDYVVYFRFNLKQGLRWLYSCVLYRMWTWLFFTGTAWHKLARGDRPHIFTGVKPLKTVYILLHWGELFQGSYSWKFEPWYTLYIADQDTARYSIFSARENCVSWAEPLKCTTDNLFSSRVFLLNLWLVYEICLLKNILIFP